MTHAVGWGTFFFLLGFTLVAGFFLGLIATRPKEVPNLPKGPYIPLDSPCPACGHIGCKLLWNDQTKKVERLCRVCGCVIAQVPMHPTLFETAQPR